MATLTNSGRTALAIALAAQTLHFAWGTGDAAWDATPVPESVDDTALINEIGRRSVTQVMYVVEDALGEIVVPTGRYAVSETPTRHILFRIAYDFADAAASQIREVALFAGTEVIAGLPAGQFYFDPTQIAAPGTLVALERIPVINRSPSTRETFEHVLTL